MNEQCRLDRQHTLARILIAVLLVTCGALSYKAWQEWERQSHEQPRQRWLAQAMDVVPNAVVGFNQSGTLHYANHAFADLAGWMPGDSFAQEHPGYDNVYRLGMFDSTDDPVGQFARFLEQARSSGDAVIMRNQRTKLNVEGRGETRQVDVLCTAVVLRGGPRLMFLAIFTPAPAEPKPTPIPPEISPEWQDPIQALMEFKFQALEHIHIPENGFPR